MGRSAEPRTGRIRPWVRRVTGARRFRLVSVVVLIAIVVAAVVVAGADGWIRYRAADREYTVDTVPASDVGLVLGAEVYPDGRPSPYLAARLDLGAALLKSGRVKALLLSGDNGTRWYDEPNAMRRYLIEHGAPAAKLAVDDAGFDTYSSCVRAERIFGVRRAIVVTQDFSVARTIALCRAVGIETTAVGDHGQPHTTTYVKCWLRDQLADTKAVWSIVDRPDPKFLGDRETSVRDAMAADPR